MADTSDAVTWMYLAGMGVLLVLLVVLVVLKVMGVAIAFRAGLPLESFEVDELPDVDWLSIRGEENQAVISERLSKPVPWESLWTRQSWRTVMGTARRTRTGWLVTLRTGLLAGYLLFALASMCVLCVTSVPLNAPVVQNEGPLAPLLFALAFGVSAALMVRSLRKKARRMRDALTAAAESASWR